jgi:hypothetical protein
MRKTYKSLRYLGHQVLGSYEFLFPLLQLKQRIRNPQGEFQIITTQFDICIAGPPRSANTFATHIFQIWNPRALIAHHVHLPVQVLLAAKWNIPCIVLLRTPADAITSLLVLGNLTTSSVILSYINFYNRILSVRSQLIVATFEDIIKQPQMIVSRVNQKYVTTFNSELFTRQQEQEVFSTIKNNRARKKELLIAIPDPEKERRKKYIKQNVADHQLFHKAMSVYNDWLRFANVNNNSIPKDKNLEYK